MFKQGSVTSELTRETRKASFCKSSVGTNAKSKNFCYRSSRRYKSVIRYVLTPHATNDEDRTVLNAGAFCVMQAQALNQQGNLNEYFGVNSAGGVIAPRNRKTYASKRLQQVVNDFREQRRRAIETSKNDNEDAGAVEEQLSSSSEGDTEAPPQPTAKRGKPRGGSSVGDAGKRRGRGGRGRGRGSARGARAGPSRKRKRSVTSTNSGGGDRADSDGQDLRSQSKTPPPPPSGTASRPRARPAFRGRGSQR